MNMFVTGGTGFVGRRLLAGLPCGTKAWSLARSAPVRASSGVEPVIGDLSDPAAYAAVLRRVDLVLHLAARTGKASTADFFAVNAEGTRTLLDACRAAGTPKFVFVSSIAATYADTTTYPYARSKQLAEQAVRESGLNYLIVRPTIVLGTGSPIGSRLAGLARLPVMPVFGDGHVQVQPVCVDDVAAFLLSIVAHRALPDAAVDLGGPEVMSFEELLRRFRLALLGRRGPVIHLPVRGAMRFLSWAERWIPTIPVSAGQLSAFVNRSVAVEPLSYADARPMRSVDEMISRTLGRV